MSKTMEWGIFRKGDAADQTPAENLRYTTRAAAERTRLKSYLNPTNWEVRGREIGPWDVKAREVSQTYANGGVIEGSIPDNLMVRHVEGRDYREYWEPELGQWVRVFTAEQIRDLGTQALRKGDDDPRQG